MACERVFAVPRPVTRLPGPLLRAEQARQQELGQGGGKLIECNR